MNKPKDLTGQVFGRLTVLHRTTQEEHPHKTGAGYHVIWTCQCECGNISYVQGSGLRNGSTISCGCANKETATKLAKKLGDKNRPNLIGQRFGNLVVKSLYKTCPTKWECLCDCGNITYVQSDNLMNGHTKSCGCLRNNYLSSGANHIKDILEKEKIPFSLEKSYSDLHKGLYRFDFCVKNFNNEEILIEYDSNLHFEYVPHFHKTEQDFRAGQQRDRVKNSYALSHGIKLFRIPYWEIENVNSFSDIISAQFLVTTKWHNDLIYRKYLGGCSK